MPRSQAWKILERQTAAALGGKRNPAAGGAGGPDVVNVPGWVLECKHRASLSVDSMFRTERAKRKKDLLNGEKFALVLRARNREALVVIALSDFAELTRQVPCRDGCQCNQVNEAALEDLGKNTSLVFSEFSE